jgi:FkbM family methyltransferase
VSLGYLRSAYGPYLVVRSEDTTYRLSLFGSYGPFVASKIQAQTQPFTFLDVGANTGVFALVAAAQPECQAAFAFEPNPETYEMLEANIALNHADVVPFPLAISAGDPGTQSLWVPEGHSGGATFRTNHDDRQHDEVRVQTVGRQFLDELATRVTAPVLLKIDVEGHESEVLDELFASALGAHVRDIIVECDENFQPEGVAGIERRLTAAGFREDSRAGQPIHFDAYWVREHPTEDG